MALFSHTPKTPPPPAVTKEDNAADALVNFDFAAEAQKWKTYALALTDLSNHKLPRGAVSDYETSEDKYETYRDDDYRQQSRWVGTITHYPNREQYSEHVKALKQRLAAVNNVVEQLEVLAEVARKRNIRQWIDKHAEDNKDPFKLLFAKIQDTTNTYFLNHINNGITLKNDSGLAFRQADIDQAVAAAEACNSAALGIFNTQPLVKVTAEQIAAAQTRKKWKETHSQEKSAVSASASESWTKERVADAMVSLDVSSLQALKKALEELNHFRLAEEKIKSPYSNSEKRPSTQAIRAYFGKHTEEIDSYRRGIEHVIALADIFQRNKIPDTDSWREEWCKTAETKNLILDDAPWDARVLHRAIPNVCKGLGYLLDHDSEYTSQRNLNRGPTYFYNDYHHVDYYDHVFREEDIVAAEKALAVVKKQYVAKDNPGDLFSDEFCAALVEVTNDDIRAARQRQDIKAREEAAKAPKQPKPEEKLPIETRASALLARLKAAPADVNPTATDSAVWLKEWCGTQKPLLDAIADTLHLVHDLAPKAKHTALMQRSVKDPLGHLQTHMIDGTPAILSFEVGERAERLAGDLRDLSLLAERVSDPNNLYQSIGPLLNVTSIDEAFNTCTDVLEALDGGMDPRSKALRALMGETRRQIETHLSEEDLKTLIRHVKDVNGSLLKFGQKRHTDLGNLIDDVLAFPKDKAPLPETSGVEAHDDTKPVQISDSAASKNGVVLQ